MKKRWQTWLRWIISILSIALLAWTLRKLDFQHIWSELARAKYFWLIPAVVVYFGAVWARTWRWYFLLRPVQKISLLKLFPIVCIGYMGNNIYPARAGELLRAYVLKERENVPISASLMTIIVERIFDGIVVLAFVFLTLPLLASLIKGDIGYIQKWAVILAAVFFGVLILLVLAVIFPKVTERFAHWLVAHLVPKKWQEKASGILSKFLSGLQSLRSPGDAVMVLLTSVVIWLIETCTYYFVMRAFSLDLSFYALMMLNGAINLFTLIPAAPGYIGTFELAGKTLLTAYQVPPETATGFTLILHATLWLPITLVGAIFFAREGFKLKSAVKEAKSEQASPPELK